MPLMTGSVRSCGQPADPAHDLVWVVLLKALSLSTIFFCNAGSLTVLGAVKIAMMWPVVATVGVVADTDAFTEWLPSS